MTTVRITQQAPVLVRVYPPGDTPVVIQAEVAAVVRVLSAGTQGPRGEAGPAGSPVRINASSAATWTLAHSLGRVPMVQVFIGAGELVLANVDASAAQIIVTHASPQAGFVLIS